MAIPAHEYPRRSLAFRGDLNPFSGIVLALVGLLAIAAVIIAADVVDQIAVRAQSREVAPAIAGPKVDRHGDWERIAVEPPFAVEDLKSTSFGLVAAAGPDGVWISDSGSHWQHSLAILDPPDGLGGSTAAIAPAESSVLGAVKAVIEFDDALYAFGNVSRQAGDEGRAWLVEWRSDDGITWDQIIVADGWDQIMDATAGADGITLFTRARQDDTAGGCCVAALYRSRDGERWANLDDQLVGLEDVQLWAATSLRDGYLAIGSRRHGDAVFSSDDGITWVETAGWHEAAPALWVGLDLHRSAWSIVDLFEGPDGVMAVLYSPKRRGIVLLASTDGTKFNVIDASNHLLDFEDKRANDWPPLTAPEGAIRDGQVVLLGEWYPKATDVSCTHLWRWTPPSAEDSPAPNRNR